MDAKQIEKIVKKVEKFNEKLRKCHETTKENRVFGARELTWYYLNPITIDDKTENSITITFSTEKVIYTSGWNWKEGKGESKTIVVNDSDSEWEFNDNYKYYERCINYTIKEFAESGFSLKSSDNNLETILRGNKIDDVVAVEHYTNKKAGCKKEHSVFNKDFSWIISQKDYNKLIENNVSCTNNEYSELTKRFCENEIKINDILKKIPFCNRNEQTKLNNEVELLNEENEKIAIEKFKILGDFPQLSEYKTLADDLNRRFVRKQRMKQGNNFDLQNNSFGILMF